MCSKEESCWPPRPDGLTLLEFGTTPRTRRPMSSSAPVPRWNVELATYTRAAWGEVRLGLWS